MNANADTDFSTMTPREMEKARILQLLTIDIGNQRVKPLTSLEALSRDIVMHINETAIYFDLFRPVDSTSAPVQIPAQVIVSLNDGPQNIELTYMLYRTISPPRR